MTVAVDKTRTGTAPQAADEAAIAALFAELKALWDAGDAEQYGMLFTQDADYIAFDGVNQKERTAIIEGHKPLFERYLKGSRLVGEITSIRFLCPDVALIHASGNTILAGKRAAEPARLSIQTLVAVKQGDEWRFTAFHNNRVRPIAGGLGNFIAWQLADLFWKLLGTKEKN